MRKPQGERISGWPWVSRFLPHNDVFQKTDVREMPGFIDGLEHNGRKPIEHLNSFGIGLKDDPSLAGK